MVDAAWIYTSQRRAATQMWHRTSATRSRDWHGGLKLLQTAHRFRSGSNNVYIHLTCCQLVCQEQREPSRMPCVWTAHNSARKHHISPERSQLKQRERRCSHGVAGRAEIEQPNISTDRNTHTKGKLQNSKARAPAVRRQGGVQSHVPRRGRTEPRCWCAYG